MVRLVVYAAAIRECIEYYQSDAHRVIGLVYVIDVGCNDSENS
jgi:hypothetical protein